MHVDNALPADLIDDAELVPDGCGQTSRLVIRLEVEIERLGVGASCGFG
jgi:hypothetical protein